MRQQPQAARPGLPQLPRRQPDIPLRRHDTGADHDCLIRGKAAYYAYWGLFQGLLPYFEQGNIANSFNFSSPSYFFATQDTVNATKQVALWCPSDPDVINGNGIYTSPGPSGMTYTMCLTSYRGINGPYYYPAA